MVYREARITIRMPAEPPQPVRLAASGCRRDTCDPS